MRSADRASLVPENDDRILVELQERRGARPAPRRGTLGLFHFAILLPDRAALGRFLRHALGRGAVSGVAHHAVSESIYLTDPDGLGIEVYADRPRAEWRAHADRQLHITTEPLNVDDLIATGGGQAWTIAPSGTTMGHVHLHVGDLDRAAAFYHHGVGLDKTMWTYPGALFLSAGGYHHHLGTNTWSRAHDAPIRRNCCPGSTAEPDRGDGLAIVAPTQRYGYVAEGKDATPAVETPYIEEVRRTHYPVLADVPIPLSDANHRRYGVSSTPTIVLLNRDGRVALYHPGTMTEAELDAELRTLLFGQSQAS